MSLFADPTGLDGSGKRLDRRVGGQVGEVVFALAGLAMFADQPHFLAGQMLRATVSDALRRAIGNSHANGGEACREQPLGSAPPTDLAPLCYLQHRLRRYGCSIGDVPLAGTSSCRGTGQPTWRQSAPLQLVGRHDQDCRPPAHRLPILIP